MRLFLVIAQHGPPPEPPPSKEGKKAKAEPPPSKDGQWETIVQPNEDRAGTFDRFFAVAEEGGKAYRDLQLISTTEGVIRRNTFDV